MSSYLPLNLPSVLGRQQKHVFAYPARIVSGAPDLAREHAGLALCNAIVVDQDREEATIVILGNIINRVAEGSKIDSTALAEALQETYEQLTNRTFVGKAEGDKEKLEGVPTMFRNTVAMSVKNFLIDEWDAAMSSHVVLSRLINLSCFYGFLHSLGMVDTPDFLHAINIMLEKYTTGSLEALMIVVIYLMSYGTMTETPRAIPLEYWNKALDHLRIFDAKLTNGGRENPDEQNSPDHDNSSAQGDTNPSANIHDDDPYRNAISTLQNFINEFINSDAHANLFEKEYQCGVVAFCIDPPPMDASSAPRSSVNVCWYLTRLCVVLKRWANVGGIDSELDWEAMFQSPSGGGQAESRGVQGRDDNDSNANQEGSTNDSQEIGNAAPHDPPRFLDVQPAVTCGAAAIWMRRGAKGFTQPKERHTPTLIPYPGNHLTPIIKVPTWAILGEGADELKDKTIANLESGDEHIQALDSTFPAFSTGSHYLLEPIDPRIEACSDLIEKMKNYEVVWKKGENGYYRAELVSKAEAVTVRPEEWVLRQDEFAG